MKLEPLVHDQGSFRDITSSQLNTIYSYTDGFIKPNKNDIYNNYKLKDKVVMKLSDLSRYYLSQRFFPGDKKLNIDIYDAIMAAKTKPYGFRPFLPGPGVGGHCIPIDPYFLLWRAKKFGAVSEFIKLSGRVNEKTQERIKHTLATGKPLVN